jgi:hypothetical protein
MLRRVLLLGSLFASSNAVSLKDHGASEQGSNQLSETVSVGCHQAVGTF